MVAKSRVSKCPVHMYWNQQINTLLVAYSQCTHTQTRDCTQQTNIQACQMAMFGHPDLIGGGGVSGNISFS